MMSRPPDDNGDAMQDGAVADDRIQRLMTSLWMPTTAAWVEIQTLEPVAKQEPVTRCNIRRTGHAAEPLQIDTKIVQDFHGHHLHLFGRSDGSTDDWEEWPRFTCSPPGGAEVTIQIWRQLAWVEGSPVAAEIVYSPDDFTKRLRIVGDDWTEDQVKAASRALKMLQLVYTKPGLKPGMVTASKYKTPAEWHQAIRDKVLPKETRLTADDTTIKNWLKISERQLYNLMKRWGPIELRNLRAGNFGECNCNSCRAN